MKELEMEAKTLKKEVALQESTLKEKQDACNLRKQEIEHQETEIQTLRGNLDKQLKIVAKKK